MHLLIYTTYDNFVIKHKYICSSIPFQVKNNKYVPKAKQNTIWYVVVMSKLTEI